MKFMLIFAALASVALADLHFYVDDKEIVDDRLKPLDVSHLIIKKGNVEIVREDAEGKNIINDQIIKFLENIREQMPHGFPELGIPPLDPYTNELISFEYSVPLLFRAQLDLRNNVLTGLSDFVIDNINFNLIRLSFDFDLTVPDINYSCDFDVHGRITVVVPFDFGGAMRLRLRDFRFGGRAQLGTNEEGYLNLRDFNLYIDIGRVSVYFENVVGDGPLNDIFNWLLSQVTNGVVQGMIDGWSEALSDAMFDVINEALGNIKLSDIIG